MIKVFSKRNQPNDGGLIYELPHNLRVQIIHIWDEVAGSLAEVMASRNYDKFYGQAEQELCNELGVFQLIPHDVRTARENVCNYFLEQRDTAKCLDTIETVLACFRDRQRIDYHNINFHLGQEIQRAVEKLNERFQEHRVGFEFRDGHITRVDSQFLHTDAVTPALELLSDPYLQGANQEFTNAQEHFRHGRYTESTNECLKAFESTMKAICHKRKWQYDQNDTAKRLLVICEKNNLFPPFLADSLQNLLSVLINVATVRNKLSGHGQGVQKNEVDKDTASFVMNSTAANILFLVSRETKLR